jgi:lactobin A/cerein 7B family class IIb bacteriocin
MSEMKDVDLKELREVEGGFFWVGVVIVAAVLLWAAPAH